jgi:hypothetical protein
VDRSLMLDTRIEAAIAGGPILRSDLIDAMADAMTVDLRGQEDLPLLLEALGTTAPGSGDPRAQEMRDRLAAWLAAETHRRDHDRNGVYDDPQAPAIMDAWWPRLVHAMFDTASGDAVNALGITIDDGDRRNHLGSAFNNGMYGHVNKDLRRVLGHTVADPWSRAYCGNGNSPPVGPRCGRRDQAAADPRPSSVAPTSPTGAARWPTRTCAIPPPASRRCPRSIGSIGRRSSRSYRSAPTSIRSSATRRAAARARRRRS